MKPRNRTSVFRCEMPLGIEQLQGCAGFHGEQLGFVGSYPVVILADSYEHGSIYDRDCESFVSRQSFEFREAPQISDRSDESNSRDTRISFSTYESNVTATRDTYRRNGLHAKRVNDTGHVGREPREQLAIPILDTPSPTSEPIVGMQQLSICSMAWQVKGDDRVASFLECSSHGRDVRSAQRVVNASRKHKDGCLTRCSFVSNTSRCVLMTSREQRAKSYVTPHHFSVAQPTRVS